MSKIAIRQELATKSVPTPRKSRCQFRPSVQRLRQIETYRQICAEAELAEKIEDAVIWPVIRNGEMFNVKYTDLRPDEIRAAYNNAFYTYSCEGA